MRIHNERPLIMTASCSRYLQVVFESFVDVLFNMIACDIVAASESFVLIGKITRRLPSFHECMIVLNGDPLFCWSSKAGFLLCCHRVNIFDVLSFSFDANARGHQQWTCRMRTTKSNKPAHVQVLVRRFGKLKVEDGFSESWKASGASRQRSSLGIDIFLLQTT